MMYYTGTVILGIVILTIIFEIWSVDNDDYTDENNTSNE